jgi:hypothetical protein
VCLHLSTQPTWPQLYACLFGLLSVVFSTSPIALTEVSRTSSWGMQDSPSALGCWLGCCKRCLSHLHSLLHSSQQPSFPLITLHNPKAVSRYLKNTFMSMFRTGTSSLLWNSVCQCTLQARGNSRGMEIDPLTSNVWSLHSQYREYGDVDTWTIGGISIINKAFMDIYELVLVWVIFPHIWSHKY